MRMIRDLWLGVARDSERRTSPGQRRWLIFCLVSTLLILALWLGLMIMWRGNIRQLGLPPWLALTLSMLPVPGSVFAGVALSMPLMPRRNLRLCLKLPRPSRGQSLMALRLAALVIPLSMLLLALTSLCVRLAGGTPPHAALARILMNCGPLEFLTVAFMAAVLAPITEEIFFRRVLFGTLKSWAGTLPALVLTSALFAAVHDAWPEYPALFLLGMAMQLLYLRCGSLYPAILLHAINNILGLLIIALLRLYTALAPLHGWPPPPDL